MDWDMSANSPASSSPLPEWLWLLCSVGTFLAHLLDGTDGKQARRTGASGPTGELCTNFFVVIKNILIII
jgi:ethanolaminephosphotransferase